MVWRTESGSKAPKREIRFLPALMSIHTNVWKAVFGKPADAIEKSVQNEDECLFALDTRLTRLTPTRNRYDHRQRPGSHS
jgi:Transport protein particle (TRAPP) component